MLALAAALLSLAASAPIASSPGPEAVAPKTAAPAPAARGVERVAAMTSAVTIRQGAAKPAAQTAPRGEGGWAIFAAGLAVAAAIVGRRRRSSD